MDLIVSFLTSFRAKVIRSLFLLYSPYVEHLRRPQVQVCDPHQLKGKVCVKLWHQLKSKEHHFFIKFLRPSSGTKVKFDRSGQWLQHSGRVPAS